MAILVDKIHFAYGTVSVQLKLIYIVNIILV
jgi:hypothetical protein